MKVFVEQGGVMREHDAAFGASALDVLQEHGYHITATCGGAGKCRKCQVMIRDTQGVRHALACLEQVTDGMLIVLEEARAMDVVDTGITAHFAPDEGLWGYGVAIDIGTTTLAAHLHDLATGKRVASASRANPQIAFGADVISRISASVDGKLDKMVEIIQSGLDEMVDNLCNQAHITRADIARCAIAGNTVMQHIACGLPPDTIGVNPFTPLSLFGDEHDMGPLGTCYLAPCIAGYVGGDITAGMLACALDRGGT
ncbi:MAG: 2Fe-2S iron-sulfur cluster binding domain-containing protein, partial [Eggerthellaceae bacterium]|nr:2Fe-2S iron-sulfur cluster binding domain-containing protein [Eggerthellaceae bacterium]